MSELLNKIQCPKDHTIGLLVTGDDPEAFAFALDVDKDVATWSS